MSQKKALLLILIFLIFLGGLSLVLIFQRNTKVGVGTSEGVIPGVSSVDDLPLLGNIKKKTEKGDIISYDLGDFTEVTAKANEIIYVKKMLGKNDDRKYADYLKKYGKPDIKLYYEDPDFEAYVFLSNGLVLITNITEDSNAIYVYRAHYFTPSDKATFLKSLDASLSEKPFSTERY